MPWWKCSPCLRLTPVTALVAYAERNPPIEEVIRQGVIPRFVEFLQRAEFPQLQVRHSGG